MVEADLFDLLKGLVGNRVFPDVAPEGTALPYITYQQIGGKVINYTGGDLPDRQHGEFQINGWASTRAGASTLALQVENAFRSATAFQSQPVSAPVAQYEPETKKYGTIQDFSIWSAR